MSRYIIAVLLCLTIIHQSHSSWLKDVWSAKPYGSCLMCHSIDPNRDIEFYLYTRQNQDTPYTMEFLNETNLYNSPLHPEYHTTIYIHGFSESALDESPKAIVNAYLTRSEHNVIVVDWGKLAASPWYDYAVDNVKVVGEHVAKFVNWLKIKNRIYLSELHIIGFSLGAHVSGLVGKQFRRQKIGRITGLDPAAPWFNKANTKDRLHKFDASFVDIIHVCGEKGGLGLRKPIGDVDFYPNQGLIQPGCSYDSDGPRACSHRRAWAYYAESIVNPQGFPASKCETWRPTVSHCTKDIDGFMGYGVDRSIRGIFLVETKSISPYSRNFNQYNTIKEQSNKEI